MIKKIAIRSVIILFALNILSSNLEASFNKKFFSQGFFKISSTLAKLKSKDKKPNQSLEQEVSLDELRDYLWGISSSAIPLNCCEYDLHTKDLLNYSVNLVLTLYPKAAKNPNWHNFESIPQGAGETLAKLKNIVLGTILLLVPASNEARAPKGFGKDLFNACMAYYSDHYSMQKKKEKDLYIKKHILRTKELYYQYIEKVENLFPKRKIFLTKNL